eukprot:4507361-Amphidinium_carterae.1
MPFPQAEGALRSLGMVSAHHIEDSRIFSTDSSTACDLLMLCGREVASLLNRQWLMTSVVLAVLPM